MPDARTKVLATFLAAGLLTAAACGGTSGEPVSDDAGADAASSSTDAASTGDAGNAALDATTTDAAADAGPGAACGGRGNPPCAGDAFCSYTREDICGRADATGVCKPRPTTTCPPPGIQAVCGCDGVVYAGECEANKAGVSVFAEGKCK